MCQNLRTCMERIGSIFFTIIDSLPPVGSQLSPSSLGLALIVAAVFLSLPHLRKRGRLRLRALWRVLFPHRIIAHRSTRADIGFFLFNCFVYGSTFGLAGLSYQFLTNGIVSGLVVVAGPVAPSTLPEIFQRSIVTLVLFLAYELGYWIDHYLKHRVPVLWEMHKVHHSAEVLTPITAFRMHPLDTFVFGQILAITAAVANGCVVYSFGSTTYQYALSETNILLVVFIHLYVHLQHTHLWIAFRGVAGRIFVSPAHHQIHHSTNPIHFNRNLGSCLAVWDWLFGTLHMPAKEREKLCFGVEPTASDAHTVNGEFVAPFGRIFSLIFGRRRSDAAAASDTVVSMPAVRPHPEF